MEFKVLFRAEDRTSDFGVSAIFHESQQKMAEGHCRDLCIAMDTAGKEYMGKKDLAGKDFFADRRRFAELLNAILYHGKDYIQAEELELVKRVYPSLSGKGEMSRDIFMKDVKRNICYGLELETESDYSMPERVMVYDACELEQQVKEISKQQKENAQAGNKPDYREKKSRMKETDFLLPVVTVVLYLGTDHWEGRRKLSELYHISEETEELMQELLPDYGFPLLEADYINAEAFETDLREFFLAMQCRNDKKKLKELFQTECFRNFKEETAWAIAVHLDRERLMPKIRKENSDMCNAIEEIFEDGKMEGRAEGRAEGRSIIIRNMIHEGMDREFICRITGCSQEEFALAAEA
ncbi:MAG: hypothetical protein HDR10_07910 [Lachnospiraceae bacterium]|nr:hypothetical protein [Lachnospiraceae bacterium]